MDCILSDDSAYSVDTDDMETICDHELPKEPCIPSTGNTETSILHSEPEFDEGERVSDWKQYESSNTNKQSKIDNYLKMDLLDPTVRFKKK